LAFTEANEENEEVGLGASVAGPRGGNRLVSSCEYAPPTFQANLFFVSFVSSAPTFQANLFFVSFVSSVCLLNRSG
jgi:hypothetical protein